MNVTKLNQSPIRKNVKAMVQMAEKIRLGNPKEGRRPIDVGFEESVKNFYAADESLTEQGIEIKSLSDFYESLGIDPSVDTIQNLYDNSGDTDIRWVVPEIIREAVLLGLRTAPIWSAVTAIEESTAGLEQTMPHINMSDAAPRKVGVAETIPLGEISYGQKKFSIYKVGRGIKIPYEVRQYTTLNAIAIFLRDFGIKMGHALDVMAINTLINGEQTDGSESAPVIGVTTAGTKVYKDMLRVWIRASRMGRNLTTIIGGEAAALETLDLDEFKLRRQGTTDYQLNMRTPLPNSAEYYIHGNVPADQEIMVDKNFALMKFNAQPLLVESEKIVSNQTEATYVTLTTGFAKMFRDAAIILDKSDTIGNLPFPSYMDVDPLQNVIIE